MQAGIEDWESGQKYAELLRIRVPIRMAEEKAEAERACIRKLPGVNRPEVRKHAKETSTATNTLFKKGNKICQDHQKKDHISIPES